MQRGVAARRNVEGPHGLQIRAVDVFAQERELVLAVEDFERLAVGAGRVAEVEEGRSTHNSAIRRVGRRSSEIRAGCVGDICAKHSLVKKTVTEL